MFWEGVVTSSVTGQGIKVDAPTLGKILGVPSQGFAVYVREDKTALETARLLRCPNASVRNRA